MNDITKDKIIAVPVRASLFNFGLKDLRLLLTFTRHSFENKAKLQA